MADKGKLVETATAAPGEARSVSPPPALAPKLAKAAESGDPQVQGLLADRSAAEQSGDSALAAGFTAQLAVLGFE